MFPGTFAATTPDKPAVVMAGSGASLTYRELEEGSARLARFLVDHGLRRGDGIALLADNAPRVYEVYWAAQRAGLYITVVNRHLAPAEVAYIVNDCGARVFVASAALGDLAAAVAPLAPDVKVRLAYGGAVDGFDDYDTALDGISSAPLPDQPRGADMLYSSGTTGRPKGIRPALPERQIDEPGDTYVSVFGAAYGFDSDTVYLSPAPLYHAAPLRFSATVQAVGGTVVVMERFDPEGALTAVERFRATHSQWVPTMFVRMLKLPAEVRERYDVSSLRVAIHAAAPCPVDVKRAMIGWWGPVLYEYYAATEGVGITFIDTPQWLAHPGSVGRGGVLGDIRICDDDTGAVLPPRQVGTIYFERDQPTFEYHNDPARTRAARHPEHENWGTVGDLGYVDEEGFLYLTDRKAFMIISGGVNIYPRDAEDVLALHPAVLDVAVIGVPDDEMGESVLAVVQPAEDAVAGPALERELIAHVREHIAHFKAPQRVVFTDDMPRTPTGKLVKQRLRDRYAEAARA
ncbi:acyl-CoA synthetase [Pseudonocardia sp.]|uniref:acyl-CoA synthetase n=1 Tax=Pseudonocardia sp. TaxID=60912 RepID=UPI0026297A8E|nr:acyl-CoA synthetase [Pseudonocardia sp.]MCW2717465.1 acyl-CoA synthetase [Pseudonocardia sp.]